MKKAFHIALLLIFVGCGGPLKNSWTNFRAYYNTYYNAQKSYQAGLEQVKDQPVEIDVTKPLRVHRAPVNSGGEQFQNTIEKGAHILRKFPDSRWVDETLGLIGKSYYYRQEYYSALQKFEEQYSVAEDDVVKQQAVVWKGRVLLDLELYNQGIVYLEDQLSIFSGRWQPGLKAETEVLLAEHYVNMDQWNQVESLLEDALIDLPKAQLKARAYFLLGQVYEIQDQFAEAAQAYDKVSSNRPGFELLYWANYKQAEVLRKMDQYDQAFAIFDQMRKDDKNVERLPEIFYEIARTEEAAGNAYLAQQIYKDILNNKTYQLSQRTRANIYYRLGNIYNNSLNRYKLAAAYYDSSSSLRSDVEEAGILEEEYNTGTLAEAYGRYSKLREKIARQDSLLWLGALPEAQFDSVIAAVRARRVQQLQEEKEKRDDTENKLLNVEATTGTGEGERTSGAYGFLNYKNSRLVTDARNQFMAVWGDRALVDNWRRIEAVRSNNREQQSTAGGDIAEAEDGIQTGVRSQVQIDLSEIPFTDDEKQLARDEIASARFELGNLFLLTLQEQDSAAHYFRLVVENHPNHSLVPKALYSLFELNASRGETERANYWAETLKEEYPESEYTKRVKERLGESPKTVQQDTSGVLLSQKVDSILSSRATTAEIAKELRTLALANKGRAAAPLVHYEAIKQYIKLARQMEMIQPIADTTLALIPVNLVKKDSIGSTFKYQGTYWDSVRRVLKEYKTNFNDSSSTKKVNKLSSELNKIVESKQEKAPTCEELDIEPVIKEGMNPFLENIAWPEQGKETKWPDSLEFEFTITTQGQVESYHLLSPNTDAEFTQAMEEGIDDKLEFVPLKLDEGIEKVRCLVTFPISQLTRY